MIQMPIEEQEESVLEPSSKRGGGVPVTTETLWKLFCLLAEYRIKMKVSAAIQLRDGVYYYCPRCKITLDREYQAYCDRCGQRLDWRGLRKVPVLKPGQFPKE